MMLVDPADVFQGVVVITAPHMDDEVLACGGMIARLPEKARLHLIYATDGMGSPEPLLSWRDAISPDLGLVRMGEARAAMGALGVPQENIHFLGLPDGRLKNHQPALRRALTELFRQVEPAHILMPFRYDRHADHLALNQAVMAAQRRGASQAELTEYFIYYRWRLLPSGDVRQYIQPSHLLEINIETVSDLKRAALDCFKSQTTRFYPWQTRPNLTPHLLDEVSRTPEVFLRYDATLPGAAIFTRAVPWIRLAHRLEPLLKKKKDQAVALWRRGWGRNGSRAE